MKIQGTIREYPAGTVVASVGVSIKRHVDDVEIGTDTTDSSGRWSYEQNGNPGPVYWVATDTGPDPDVVRQGSTFNYGSAGTYSEYEMTPALRSLGNGIIADYLDELAVTYDAAGLDLDVATGAAMALGIPAVFNAVSDHTVTSTRDATNTKACYLVIQFTGQGEAEEGKAVLADVCGTAAATPALPALTQTDALYELPLATFVLPTSASTTLTSLVDARPTPFLGIRHPVVTATARRTDPTSEATTTSTTGADATSLTATPTLVSGITYDIEVRGTLLCKISDDAQTAQMSVYANGTSEIATFITTNSESYVLLSNVHTVAGVVGAGTTIACGVRVKVSSGTMSYATGTLLVIARPRT